MWIKSSHCQEFLACLTGCVVIGLVASSWAQDPPDPNYVRGQIFDSYVDFKNELNRVTNIPDPDQRATEVDAFWQMLLNAGQVPYAQGNQVAFLTRSNGSVSWPGDASGWNPSAAGWQGSRVGQSDIVMVEHMFPTDARVDYKLFVNGAWQLDPYNPLQMWGGFGPNNELRMPDYEFPQETVERSGIDHGTLSENIRLSSSNLGYDVNVRVYTPAGYGEGSEPLPTVYVTDGHEYAAEHLGSSIQVMDNLIADQRLRPVVAVFIDPRNPDTGANQRADQYIANRDFARFVADELVAYIDANFSTSEDRGDRTILGTSLGGLNSAYFGVVENDVFQNLAIQSPAFWPAPESLTPYLNGGLADRVRIFMTNGTIRDDGGGFDFANILAQGGYDFAFTTANESHSWGNWRAQLDDMLIELVGAPVPEPNSLLTSLLGLIGLGFMLRQLG